MKTEIFNQNWTVNKRGGSVGLETSEGLRAVTLPYDAMIAEKRSSEVEGSFRTGYYPNGVWEFKKKFFVPESLTGKKVIFRFDGVYERSSVYINGDHAGGRAYGYSQFFVGAERFLKYGQENEITVIARSADDSRWYAGCGIYRDVYMMTADPVYLPPNGVKISTPMIRDDEACVCISASVFNGKTWGKGTFRVSAEIMDEEGNTVGSCTAPLTVDFGKTAAACLKIYIPNPQRWDVDQPYLYTCMVKVTQQDGAILDECSETFGIRSLSISPASGLQINERTVKLRGACVHHDNGPLGAVSTEFVEERKIRKLKEAGFNAIRCSHNPAGAALLKVCDRLGMLVMNEAFDVWTRPKVNFDYAVDFPAHWEEDIESFVASSFNHPSVILYSIGNEIPETGSSNGAVFGRKIAAKIKSLDSSRFTLNSINGMMSVLSILESLKNNSQAAGQEQHTKEQAQQVQEQQSGDINAQMTDLRDVMSQIMSLDVITYATEEAYANVDVAGYNYMDVRYEKDRELFPNRIICGTETYPPAIAKNWELISRCTHVIGDFTWTGWDYLGEAGIGLVKREQPPAEYGVSAPYPSLTAYCGDISISGLRRPMSYYREIVFGLRKDPYIAVQRPELRGREVFTTPWSWSESISNWSYTGYEGKPVTVEVYSDAEEVALDLNGERIGIKKTECYKAVFDVAYQPGKLTAISIRNGSDAEIFELESAAGPERLVLRTEQDTADTGEMIYIHLSLEDENGNVFPVSDRQIDLLLEGEAELLAFANDDPLTEENFFDSTRSLFDGRALAILRPVGTGVVTVTATSGSLRSECKIQIRA